MGKKSKNQSNNQSSQDDVLFEALGNAKKKRKRKIMITVAVIVAVVGIGLTAAVISLKNKVKDEFGSTGEEVISAQATVGSISTTVSGSGTLSDVDLETITVPAGVEIEEILVSANDSVEEGDTIAMLNSASIVNAMTSIQEELESLDEQIAEAKDDTVADTITAGVAGRVKKIYAQEDGDVSKCMYENGVLMVISLDGYMALDISNDSLAEGDGVTVVRGDGSELSGSVEEADDGTAVILVTDDGTAVDEAVTVKDSDGNELGTGTLYVHNALRITGVTGTISAVNVSENQSVSADTAVISLEDTEYTAGYETLLQERAEKEEELLELLSLHQAGALLAPFSGSVNSIDYKEGDSSTSTSLGSGSEEEETSVLTLSPNLYMSFTISVDETDILSLEEGQEVEVTIQSIGEDTFAGTVTDISKSATSSSGVTQYSAEITLDKNAQMLPGMTAEAVVKIEGVEDAVLIPIEALHQTSATAYVYTEYNEETGEYSGMKEVVTGLSNSTYVEITSGLSEGETVYYTESESMESPFGNGGNMNFGDFEGGDMPSGGNMPSGGDMPSGGGMPGGRGGSGN